MFEQSCGENIMMKGNHHDLITYGQKIKPTADKDWPQKTRKQYKDKLRNFKSSNKRDTGNEKAVNCLIFHHVFMSLKVFSSLKQRKNHKSIVTLLSFLK